MKIKTKDLTGAALDWAVAKCESPELYIEHFLAMHNNYSYDSGTFAYSTAWAQGGPILSRERISRTIDHSGLWVAYWTDGYADGDEGKKWMQCDSSEIVAGLRCYIASKLGDEVDVPEELM